MPHVASRSRGGPPSLLERFYHCYRSYFSNSPARDGVIYGFLMLLLVSYAIISVIGPFIAPACDKPAPDLPFKNPDYNPDPCLTTRFVELGGITLRECWFIRCIISSMILGSVIGYERRSPDRAAGIRSMSLTALGACCFTIAGNYACQTGPMNWDASRISAAIPSGVGFLGAGIIWCAPHSSACASCHLPTPHARLSTPNRFFPHALPGPCNPGGSPPQPPPPLPQEGLREAGRWQPRHSPGARPYHRGLHLAVCRHRCAPHFPRPSLTAIACPARCSMLLTFSGLLSTPMCRSIGPCSSIEPPGSISSLPPSLSLYSFLCPLWANTGTACGGGLYPAACFTVTGIVLMLRFGPRNSEMVAEEEDGEPGGSSDSDEGAELAEAADMFRGGPETSSLSSSLLGRRSDEFPRATSSAVRRLGRTESKKSTFSHT